MLAWMRHKALVGAALLVVERGLGSAPFLLWLPSPNALLYLTLADIVEESRSKDNWAASYERDSL